MLDYVYGVLRVPYSFQIKLRDLGSYGFLLPKESIIPAGEEMFSLLRYFSQWLLDDGGPTIKDGPGEL
jgi:extracellular matrix protein 14